MMSFVCAHKIIHVQYKQDLENVTDYGMFSSCLLYAIKIHHHHLRITSVVHACTG